MDGLLNQDHIEGCSTTHETCAEMTGDTDASEYCHVYGGNYGESAEFTIVGRLDNWEEPPEDSYEIWLWCHCHCSYARLGQVNKNGRVSPGHFQTRAAAYGWAIRRFPPKTFMVLATDRFAAIPR